MRENSFEKFNQPDQGNEIEQNSEKKEKREMSIEEVAEIGEEMEGYLEFMLNRAREIEKELEEISDKGKEEILREELMAIKEQLEQDQEGLEGFIEDIKSDDFSEPKIDK